MDSLISFGHDWEEKNNSLGDWVCDNVFKPMANSGPIDLQKALANVSPVKLPAFDSVD